MIDATIKLRIARCQTCGVTFAVDAAAYTEAMKAKAPLSCPIGDHVAHAWSDVDSLDSIATNLQLLAELQQVKHDLNATQRELMTRPALAESPMDDKELQRRVNMLAARAERTHYGRLLCRFCGKPKAASSVRHHMKTYHRDEVAALSAENFI